MLSAHVWHESYKKRKKEEERGGERRREEERGGERRRRRREGGRCATCDSESEAVMEVAKIFSGPLISTTCVCARAACMCAHAACMRARVRALVCTR
jgi:hypothetical protein